MRLSGQDSWQISMHDSPLLDGALWIRTAERIEPPQDDLVPGPLDLDRVPEPTKEPPPAAVLAEQWLDWWRSLVDAPNRHPPGHPAVAGPVPEPAFDTPDPLGLARLPVLAALVARRWPEVVAWQSGRPRGAGWRVWAPLSPDNSVVADFERSIGRRARPFQVEFVLLPVRDHEIRRVYDHRYLVPERVYGGPWWADWLGDLVRRIG